MTKYKKRVITRRKKRSNSFNMKASFVSFSGNKKVVSIGVGCLVVVSFITYLVQINAMATKGFEIRKLEDNIVALQKKNKSLQLDMIELQSMTTLKNKVRSMNLVEADEVAYYNSVGTRFAQK